MTYRIRFTNKNKTPIEIGENSINNSSVDITLFGRKKLEYGADLNANFLHLLEHFACPEAAFVLPTPSPTPSSAVCITAPPTPTPSSTPAPGVTITPTPTITVTPTPTIAITPSVSITPSSTPAPGVTITPTPSGLPLTPQASAQPSPTPTRSSTPVPASITPTPTVTPTPSPNMDPGTLIPFGSQSIEQYSADFHSTGIWFNGFTNDFIVGTENTRYHYRLETNGFTVTDSATRYVDTGAVLGDEPSDWQNQYWIYITGGASPGPYTTIAAGSVPINQWTLIGTDASYQVDLDTSGAPAPTQQTYAIQVYMQRSATQPTGLGGATLMGALTVIGSRNAPV